MQRTSYSLLPFLIAFLAFSFTSQSLKACTCLPEDVNNDGIVDINDIIIASEAFASYPGHRRWNPKADVDSDGKVGIKDIISIAAKFGTEETNSRHSVWMNITPETLNLKSKGRWITMRIKFYGNCNFNEANLIMLKLNNTVPAEIIHAYSNVLIAKFSRSLIESYISDNALLSHKFTVVKLSVTGEIGETTFTATDSIKVIDAPD